MLASVALLIQSRLKYNTDCVYTHLRFEKSSGAKGEPIRNIWKPFTINNTI